EPAGDQAVGIEMSDQCLHGLSLHQDLLQTYQVVQGGLREGGGEVAGAGIERIAAGDLRVRGREVRGERGLAARAPDHRLRLRGRRHERLPQTVVSSRAAACAGTAGAALIPFSSFLRRSSNPLLASAPTSTSTAFPNS